MNIPVHATHCFAVATKQEHTAQNGLYQQSWTSSRRWALVFCSLWGITLNRFDSDFPSSKSSYLESSWDESAAGPQAAQFCSWEKRSDPVSNIFSFHGPGTIYSVGCGAERVCGSRVRIRGSGTCITSGVLQLVLHQAPQTRTWAFPPSALISLYSKSRVGNMLLCRRASAKAWHTKATRRKESPPGSPKTYTGLASPLTDLVVLQVDVGQRVNVLESFSESLAHKGNKEAISPHQAPQTPTRA